MGEPVDGTGAARLEELAAVTREYAKYSRTRSGFAIAAAGACLLLGVAALLDGGVVAANVLVVFAPLVWLAILPLARTYYQRRGEVIEHEPQPDGPAWPVPVGVYVSAVVAILFRLGMREGRLDGEVMVTTAALVGLPTLAGALRHRLGDLSATMSGLMGPAMVPVERWEWLKWLVAGLGAIAVWRGALEHLAHRRLERRLAALKGVAP